MKSILKTFLFAGLLGCTALACSSPEQVGASDEASRTSQEPSNRENVHLGKETLRELHAALASAELDHLTVADVQAAMEKAKREAPQVASDVDRVSASDLLTQIASLRDQARASSADDFISGVRNQIAQERFAGSAHDSVRPTSAAFMIGFALGAAIVACASSDRCILWMCNNVYC